MPPRPFPPPCTGSRHSNESPPLSVSVSGKRDFAGQRQQRRKGLPYSTDRQQRRRPRTKTHQFGAICTTPGNLRLYGTAWWTWEDSNFEPSGYEPPSRAGRTRTSNQTIIGRWLWALTNGPLDFVASEVPEVAELPGVCATHFLCCPDYLGQTEWSEAAGTALQLDGDQKIARAFPVWTQLKQ
jgi:hypothetical protein